MEPNLQEMWEEAERNFEKITSKKLRPAGAPKTLNDVVREMESKEVENDSDGTKIKTRVTQLGQRVVKCIQLLGGIAAQGAAMVSPMISSQFPPYSSTSSRF